MIIDGWNVCWKIPEIAALIPEDLELARRKLNAKIKAYCQSKKNQYKIIYDGQPHIYNRNIHSQNRHIQFSKDPQKADSLIINFLRKQHKPHEWTVVTSDQELSIRAANLEAQVVPAELFVEKIKSKSISESDLSAKENPNINKTEMDYWLKKFKQN